MIHIYTYIYIYICTYVYICIYLNVYNHVYFRLAASDRLDRRQNTANLSSRSILQCVAVCCSVLQCVAVCSSVLQYTANLSSRSFSIAKIRVEPWLNSIPLRIGRIVIWGTHVFTKVEYTYMARISLTTRLWLAHSVVELYVYVYILKNSSVAVCRCTYIYIHMYTCVRQHKGSCQERL